jgi:hypothetical protein
MTSYALVQSDKSHRRRLTPGIKLNNEEGGDAPIRVLEELKVPEFLVRV